MWISYPHLLWITRIQDEFIAIISSSLCVHYVDLWKTYPHFLWITQKHRLLCGKLSFNTGHLLRENPHRAVGKSTITACSVDNVDKLSPLIVENLLITACSVDNVDKLSPLFVENFRPLGTPVGGVENVE